MKKEEIKECKENSIDLRNRFEILNKRCRNVWIEIVRMMNNTMNPVTFSRIHLIRLRSMKNTGTQNQSTSLIFQLHENRVREEETGTLLSSLAKRTNHLSRRGKKISFLSHLLFLRSHHRVMAWRQCNGFLGKTSGKEPRCSCESR